MSPKNQSTETSDALHMISGFAGPPVMYNTQAKGERSLGSAQRYSMTSVSSSGRRSSSSLEGSAKSTQSRPSGIPRSTSAISQARLKALAASRAAAATQATAPKIPSVEPAVPVMHRYPIANANPILQQDPMQLLVPQAGYHPRRTTVSQMDAAKDTVLGVVLPQRQVTTSATDLPPRLIPELQALAASTHRPRVATGSASTISSPSTQFTNSPSPWSASTAATTPISWSSASPSISQPARAPLFSKRSHTVPVPAITRTRLPALPTAKVNRSAPRSLPPVSAASEATTTPPRKIRRTPSESPAPTPPPRSSSIKRTRSQSSSKSEDPASLPFNANPPPLPSNVSGSVSLGTRINDQSRGTQNLSMSNLTSHHNTLQHAINYVPAPKASLDTEGPQPQPKQQYNLTPVQDGGTRQLLASAPIEAVAQPTHSARSRLAKFSRMALFGRTGKDLELENESDSKNQPRKLQRKGPVAGTGHEGYGKYTRRGRRSSTEGSTTGTDSEGSVVSTTRKPAQAVSQKGSMTNSRRDRRSQSDLDDFATSRLKPVVIIGGTKKPGLSSNHGTAITTTTLTSVESITPTRAETGIVPKPSSEPFSTHLEDASSIHDTERPPMNWGYHSSSNNVLKRDRLSASASIPVSVERPYSDSRNTSQSSIVPSSLAATDIHASFHHVNPKSLESQRKKSRKLRWNIFRKKDYEPQNEHVHPSLPSQNTAPELMVNVSTFPVSRPIPYYAVLENETEPNDTAAISNFLTEAAELTDIEDDTDNEEVYGSLMGSMHHGSRQHAESVLLPSAPQFKQGIEPSRMVGPPKVAKMLNEPPTMADTSKAPIQRQPRLAQIGRIPKVVPTKQAKQPVRTSFSRPFQQAQVSKEDRSRDSGIRSLQFSSKPALEVDTGLLPNHPLFNPSNSDLRIVSPYLEATTYTKPTDQLSVTDHLRFNDRQSTTSASSDGMISVMAPPLLPSADVANPAFRRTFTEDDVWNEYDDFIDHVTSPQNLENPSSQLHERARITATGPSSVFPKDVSNLPILARGLAIDTSFNSIPIINAALDVLQESDLNDEVRLRRSRIVSALHSSIDPSSPFSIADYFAEHRSSIRLSSSTTSNIGYSSPKVAHPESLPNLPGIQHYENAAHIDKVQRTKNPIRHSELSYTSLMVSRWLSFGRVLFSPAHIDLQKQPERHVLVIDGLGSDDWSMYCAVTYQAEQAYIYEVKETGRSQTSRPSKRSKDAPPNLRMREVASFYDPLKFPDNFFAAIVLRFPPVMAESKLRHLFSECRRVLTPGGYMELTLLDLDIVNMGMHTRKAMRDLKTKISVADPGVSLRPVIDNCQNVLGEQGFSKLSKCVVGVPVVGKPPGVSGSPVSSRSSGGSDKQHFSSNAGPRPLDGLREQSSHNFSLNDLVADHSDTADAKISKMVSRTARSWWQHCFETAVISDGDLSRSILADKRVLNECKSRASSFKLLIAYTQKPSVVAKDMKRRTMSEPTIATLATA